MKLLLRFYMATKESDPVNSLHRTKPRNVVHWTHARGKLQKTQMSSCYYVAHWCSVHLLTLLKGLLECFSDIKPWMAYTKLCVYPLKKEI